MSIKARLTRLEGSGAVNDAGPTRPFEHLTDSELLERVGQARGRAVNTGNGEQVARLDALLASWGVSTPDDLPRVLEEMRAHEGGSPDVASMRITRLRYRVAKFRKSYPGAPS